MRKPQRTKEKAAYSAALLLKPYDAKLMDAYIIENDFIKKAPTDPSILQRA